MGKTFKMAALSKWTSVGLMTGLLTAISQPAMPVSADDRGVMLAAVSRDNSMLMGGISWGGPMIAQGTADVEPFVRLTESGKWHDLNCTSDNTSGCPAFERDYLSKPHKYTVISADGHGATIYTPPAKLSECYDFTEKGSYTGGSIAGSAIATSTPDLFTDSPPPHLLNRVDAEPVLKALSVLIPEKLDSNLHLRIYSLQLDNHDLVLIQRAAADVVDPLKRVFMIGEMERGRFQLLYQGDEEERNLGTVRVKNGHGFLITTVLDSESQRFHVYGFQDGKLMKIYSGGGSSC